MNLFQKYGIKEVADVVFYSINQIGDEEFYTPVLYLDTLKVSTIEKAAEKVSATGGKGNKKLITWNFGKEITLNIEDALFSPASQSMIWGGKLNSNLSDYTSAIVKCNLANKYGEKNYSVKAYPSPALTDNEWEIVFNAANKLGINSGANNDNPRIYIGDEKNVSENRMTVIKNYFKRNNKNFGNYEYPVIDANKKIRNYLTAFSDDIDLTGESEENIQLNSITISVPNLTKQELLKPSASAGKRYTWDSPDNSVVLSYQVNGEEKKAYYKIRIYYYIDNNNFYIYNDSRSLFSGILITQTQGDFGNGYIRATKPDSLLSSLLQDNSIDTSWLNTNSEKAISNDIVKDITSQLTSLDKIGNIETDFQDIEVIDRMEKCIVKDKDGLKINPKQQKENLFKYYTDDKSSSYTIFYDAKTMLPLFNVSDGNILNETQPFRIKMGTIYYKWTRTVKYKNQDTDSGILGRTLVIDAETFPDAYKIVGETYIREQKTGKDQRYQFVIHRANVSSNTSISLQADGDPTTFSMQIDVLTPANDIMMELKQFNVEDDIVEGGTRITPQKSTYTYTPANIEYVEKEANKNEEFY